MNQEEIKKYLEKYTARRERTIVVVDFGNVDKWRKSLRWSVGIRELGNLVKNFSQGKKFLRRFYYGSDYGKSEYSRTLGIWSASILDKARMNGFEIVTKRVKYIHDKNNQSGYAKKCDLDVEMTVDLIRERDNYDTILLFSGDGDLMCAMRYLAENYGKKCLVFGARGHVGREIYDAKNDGIVEDVFYAEDFEYRLNMGRFQPGR